MLKRRSQISSAVSNSIGEWRAGPGCCCVLGSRVWASSPRFARVWRREARDSGFPPQATPLGLGGSWRRFSIAGSVKRPVMSDDGTSALTPASLPKTTPLKVTWLGVRSAPLGPMRRKRSARRRVLRPRSTLPAPMRVRMPRNLRSESPSQGTKRKRVLRPVQASLRVDSADQPPLNTASPWPAGPSQNDSSSSAPQSSPSRGHVGPELGDGLDEVKRTHRALNIVFTFCCTRKHVVTTFNNIKAAVESHLGKPLTVEDVAAVVAIRPEAINFAYVDELTLQNDAKGSERDTTFKSTTPRNIASQGPPLDASVGGLTGNDSLESSFSFDSADEEGEVLYLEFVDGDVKPQSSKTTDLSQGGPGSSSQSKTFGLPQYSWDGVSSLIDRRNRKFNDSLSAFVDECVRSETVPLQRLRERAKLYLPTRSSRLTRNGGSTVPDYIPAIRESIPKIVLELRSSPWYTGQIVPEGYRVFESQPAIYGDLNFRLSQDLVNALYNSRGIIQLYAHQTEALNCLLSGNNVVVATSTSSGKSLIYQLPVLHALEEDRSTRAMYVFPTKALAQDQKRSLRELLHYMPQLEDVLVATFDGDTPMADRRTIREDARIVFTNPDMLHVTVLPNEERWRKFLQHLKYVVGKLQPSRHGLGAQLISK